MSLTYWEHLESEQELCNAVRAIRISLVDD